MSQDREAELEDTVRRFRNILPYLKDWNAWHREIRRLERNVVKLRRNRYPKLARTLEESLALLKSVLDEEKVEHAFTVNQLVAKLDKLGRGRKGIAKKDSADLRAGLRGFRVNPQVKGSLSDKNNWPSKEPTHFL